MRLHSWGPAAAGLLLATAAFAADVISPAHDGVYAGAALPNPALSGGSCAAISLGKVIIAQGNLRSEPSPTTAWITGIVTENGHVKGSMARPGGPRRPLEGRLTGDTISAGFIEPEAQGGTICAWQIELKRAPS